MRLKIVLSVVAIAGNLNAGSLKEDIDRTVRRYADAGLFSGVVLVSKGNDVVYEGAFGLADRSFGVPNTPETKFQIASLSKPITAAAVLMLAEQGKLRLADTLSKFVPDFPGGDRITVQDLLTHYSGLPDASSDPDYAEWSRFPQTTASLVERVKKKPLRSEPGTRYAYSNSNYHVLAFLIERVSGESYGDFLEKSIFHPAAMASTAHRGDDGAVIANLAVGYMPAGVSDFVRPPFLDWTSKTGNGSLYSTARDLLRFDRWLRSATGLSANTVLNSYGFDRSDRKVGMFWFHRERFGHRSVYVNGSSPGYKASLERFIDDDAAVIVLSNFYLASPSIIGAEVGALLFGQTATADVPKPVKVPKEALARLAGTFQFAGDYFTPNAVVRVEPRQDHVLLVFPATGFTIPLVPVEGGRFFDRNYWSFVRFEKGNLIYRNDETDYVAVAVPR